MCIPFIITLFSSIEKLFQARNRERRNVYYCRIVMYIISRDVTCAFPNDFFKIRSFSFLENARIVVEKISRLHGCIFDRFKMFALFGCIVARLADRQTGNKALGLSRIKYYVAREVRALSCHAQSRGRNIRQLFQLRELYTKAVYTSDLSESSEYKECLKLLGFLSKEELVAKLESMAKILDGSEDPTVKEIKSNLDSHIDVIREASLSIGASSEVVSMDEKLNRRQLKEVGVQVPIV